MTQAKNPQKKQVKSSRLFENDILEYFSHVHPIVPLLIWGPISTYLVYRGYSVYQMNALTLLFLAFAGLLVWTLTEYALHRYVFHYVGHSALSKRIHHLIHGIHHDEPEDGTRLVMPPVAAFIIAGILFAFFRLLIGPVYVEPFFGFFLIGYLCYDYIHYSVHHFRPRTPIGRYLKQSHMLHHFAESDVRWGVSSPLWDIVFGTLGNKEKTEKLHGKTN